MKYGECEVGRGVDMNYFLEKCYRHQKNKKNKIKIYRYFKGVRQSFNRSHPLMRILYDIIFFIIIIIIRWILI